MFNRIQDTEEVKQLADIEVSGKRVLVRADIDVNVEQLTIDKLQLTEVTRLQNLKPTIEYLISHNAKQIIIAGHIGRPKQLTVDGSQLTESTGKSKFYEEKLSTKHLVPVLEKLLGQKITFSPDVILGSEATPESNQADFGQARMIGDVVLLENLRFWEGEEKNDPEFAKRLASLADIYINEAFGVCHRTHASVVGVPAILPHAAGLHLEEEVKQLTKLIKNPDRPLVVIIGGAKLETKLPVIVVMAKLADKVLVGGLIAKEITNYKLQITKNVVVAGLTGDTKDIDDESIEKFIEIIYGAKTVVWNGPVGHFEGGFEKGTLAVANAIINSGAYSVIGGGETTEFLGSKNLLSKFSFVSSGGGAMLEFLSGTELPGIKVLA